MFVEICQQVSLWAIPIILVIVPVVGYFRHVKRYMRHLLKAQGRFSYSNSNYAFLGSHDGGNQYIWSIRGNVLMC